MGARRKQGGVNAVRNMASSSDCTLSRRLAAIRQGSSGARNGQGNTGMRPKLSRMPHRNAGRRGRIMKTIGRTAMPRRRTQHGPPRPVEGNCFHQAQPRSCGCRWQGGVEDEFHFPSRGRRRQVGWGGRRFSNPYAIHPHGRSGSRIGAARTGTQASMAGTGALQ